jgi:hypothetical protein
MVFEEIRARFTIVKVSLSYLLTAAQDGNCRKTLESYPLSAYCARYWMKHAAVAKENEDLAREWINKFFAAQDAYAYWLGIYDPDDSDCGYTYCW